MVQIATITKRPRKSQVSNLTGVWSANDGGRYYIRQIGRRVYWAGLSNAGEGTTFTNVFAGRRRGDIISGRWADVPRGVTLGSGTITLRVFVGLDGVARLTRIRQTGGFGGSEWTFLKFQGTKKGNKK